MPDSKNDAHVEKTDAEWKSELTPEQFRITRKAGTEAPFTHQYNENKRNGTYACVCCGQSLFPSRTKYNSGTGWPSFYAPENKESVTEHEDNSLFSTRTEICCSKCAAHLGHVFPDGPDPTGLRYCINGEALSFEAEGQDGNDDNDTA